MDYENLRLVGGPFDGQFRDIHKCNDIFLIDEPMCQDVMAIGSGEFEKTVKQLTYERLRLSVDGRDYSVLIYGGEDAKKKYIEHLQNISGELI